MRLGFFPREMIGKLKNQKIIWLHTVSVGEAQAAEGLIKELRQSCPEFRLVVSTVTKTGNAIVRKLLNPQEQATYFPLDIRLIVEKFIKTINPKIFIAAETEIWPVVTRSLSRRGVPLILINGRISSGSFKGYKLVRFFIRGILKKFDLLCMQTKEDAQRIIALGADESRVKITGNMKFDIDSSSFTVHSSELKLKENEKLLIAGSTHPGEEKIILETYKDLIKIQPNLRLLIAPRHIERTAELEGLIKKFGFQSQRLSRFNSNLSPITYHLLPILLLDTIGRLKSLYALAEFVFIGGSLVPHGGQNPIEPAYFSKAIIFGPYMNNFSKVADIFLNSQAAIRVKDAAEFKHACVRLTREPNLRARLGHSAKTLIEENRGATSRNIELIKPYLC